jgi:tetratricopeptide (TPR) repeat protein
LENKHNGVAILQIDKDLTIGQRFKKMRMEKGFSQAGIAEGICSSATISHLECDRHIPTPHILGKLAEKLGVSLYDIMGTHETQMEANFLLDMVRVYIEKGEITHALELIKEFDGLSHTLEHQRYILLTLEVECLIRQDHNEQAINRLTNYLESYEIQANTDDQRLCTLYNYLGTAYYQSNDMTNAFSCYMRAYKSSMKFQTFDMLSADVAYHCGMICNQLGMTEEARFYLQKAHDFYSSVSDMKHLADTYFHLAIATKQEGYIKNALSIYTNLNIVNKAHLARQFYAFNIKSKEDYRGACEDLQQTALEFEKLFGDMEMCVYTFSRAATICMDHEDFETAVSYINEASQRINRLKNPESRRIAYYFFVFARLCLLQHDYEACILHAKKSGIIFSKVGMKKPYADAMYLVAEAYGQLGMFEEAYKQQKEVSDTLLR